MLRSLSVITTALLSVLFVGLIPATVAEAATPSTTWSVVPADDNGPDGRRWLDVEVDPGERVEEKIAVRNLGSEETTFTLSAADGYFTENGRFNMLPSTTASTGAGTWVSLPASVTVPPNGTAVVPVQLAVPDNATPGDHAAGIAASITSGAAAGSGVGVESRVGIRTIFHVAGELRPAATVDDVVTEFQPEWNPFLPGRAVIRFTLTNVGNTQLQLNPAINLQGPFGSAQTEVASDSVDLLPGGEREIEHTFTGVWPIGWLTTGITVSAPDVTETGAATAPAVPYSQLLLSLAVVGLVWFQLWNRRRRRTQLEELLRQARREGAGV